MTHHEIEYKTLLSQEEFQKIEKQLLHVEPVSQTNYYFDTEDFALKGHKMSLRIRTYSDRAELTLKIPQDIGNLEYNQALSLGTAASTIDSLQFPDGEIKSIISQHIPIENLNLLGHLTTVRREIPTKIGLMALDCNTYADRKDYELELEVTEAQKGKADFEAFLQANQIKFKYAKSKVARFSATLAK